MKKVLTAGGLIYKNGQVLLVKNGAMYALPKGHLEKGETPEMAAKRELQEETGYEVKIVKELGSVFRKSLEDGKELVAKEIRLYLMVPLSRTDGPTDEECAWVDIDVALQHMKFVEEKEFLIMSLSSVKALLLLQ